MYMFIKTQCFLLILRKIKSVNQRHQKRKKEFSDTNTYVKKNSVFLTI